MPCFNVNSVISMQLQEATGDRCRNWMESTTRNLVCYHVQWSLSSFSTLKHLCKQVSVEPCLSAVNVTLLTFVAEHCAAAPLLLDVGVDRYLLPTWLTAASLPHTTTAVKWCVRQASRELVGLRAHHATFTPHETKLTSTDLKPSQRQLLRRLWRRL